MPKSSFISIFSTALFLSLAAVAGPASATDRFREAPLTEAQILNYVKADAPIQAVLEKIAAAGDEPDPTLLAELENTAKKNGFSSFDEFDVVGQTIAFIALGFDSESDAFIEPKNALQDELAAVRADSTLPEEEKTERIAELKAAIAATPLVKHRANIDIIRKHLDKIDALL